ncbi:MAG: DNA gyrase subunit A [Bacilli bacterium]|nr:DNA gyrase subunit A [Bacilli bacterium]
MKTNDLINELGQNFIEYAVAVNTDRAIPDAKSGLKPVAKRILYGTFDKGFSSAKPHVKCANIVGNVMAEWHPHGDSSIYGALVRLSQDWVMRYPLIDFHGSNGNRDGDGPAAYRYTEARLAKLTEEGLLAGIKKNNVDFIPNYSETKKEPVTLPSIFPNLLCNPNTGIGVAMACNWLPHNLGEVAQAIYDYMDGKEPTLPGPDFPTGGVIINQKDLADIIRTGHGSVKLRGKYDIEDNNIVFYEIPYGVATEALMEEIGKAVDEGKINGITNIRNESNRKKGFRLVIECDKNSSMKSIINLLFKETNLQTSISYNQVALINKTPTEMGLKDCIKIYIEHNVDCIRRETEFDRKKAMDRLEIIEGLLRALEDIDNIIALIKASESSAKAKIALMEKYKFSEPQAKAILDMKLSKLANLEKIEIQQEKEELIEAVNHYDWILMNTETELRSRLEALVKKYGDARRTEITQIADSTKEEKEIQYVEPEKCVVVMTEGGTIKRIPATSFRTQKRNGKGIKTQEDITHAIIRTNTIDSLMIFSNQGKMYRLLVDDIPVGTNASKGAAIKGLVPMEGNEQPAVMYSIYRDTDAKYVMFVTKNGLVKKTALEEYIGTKKKTGIGAINLKDGDALAAVTLIKDEPIALITAKGYVLKFNSMEVGATSRMTSGVKGINLVDGDYVVAAMPVRNAEDALAIFAESGVAKKILPKEAVLQKRGGRGLNCYKGDDKVVAAAMVSDEDSVLIVGDKTSICVSATDIPALGRTSIGNQMIKGSKVMSVSKV